MRQALTKDDMAPASQCFGSADDVTPLGNAVGDAFLVVDAAQRVVVFNRAAQRVFGFDRVEVLGNPLTMLLPDRFHGSHRGQVNGFRSHGLGHRVSASARSSVGGRRKDGSEFPAEVTLAALEVSGEVMVAAVVRDVSARVAIERALSESEERFRVAFEHSPVAMALVNLEGRCTSANQALAELTGYPVSVLVGVPMMDLVDQDDLPALVESINRLRSGDSPTARIELRQRDTDGLMRVVDLNLALVVNSDGEALYMIAQSLDVTERVQSRARLEEMLASKNELIATVSHELRTPLTAFLGFAQLLHDEGSALSAEERAEMIEAIVTESVDMANTVEDLVVAAKVETDALAVVQVAVDLRAQAAQVLEAWRRSEVEHVELVGPRVRGLGDPARVRQIVRNLISNALRYGGERIVIRTGGDETMARIEVVDNGAAISPGDQERIFLPYQRAHETVGVTPSMGFGLTISGWLARLMDGDLKYRRDGDQNLFELTLPATEAEDSS
jgi:PAS domain S-box-containing protein